MVYQLLFQRALQAFRRCDVVTVALPGHRGTHPGGLHGFLVIKGPVLAASIGMVDASGTGLYVSDGLLQGGEHQLLGHSRTHGVANDLPASEVLYIGQIKPTFFVGGNVGDIGTPDGTFCFHLAILVQKIRVERHVVFEVSGGLSFFR